VSGQTVTIFIANFLNYVIWIMATRRVSRATLGGKVTSRPP
jgi:hypothetical protein